MGRKPDADTREAGVCSRTGPEVDRDVEPFDRALGRWSRRKRHRPRDPSRRAESSRRTRKGSRPSEAHPLLVQDADFSDSYKLTASEIVRPAVSHMLSAPHQRSPSANCCLAGSAAGHRLESLPAYRREWSSYACPGSHCGRIFIPAPSGGGSLGPDNLAVSHGRPEALPGSMTCGRGQAQLSCRAPT